MGEVNSTSHPLVSVRVITYNSSRTVIETLDSIKNQTYQNIELIISDDCSPDNTVEVCEAWLEANKSRFARTELITVTQNTGTAANINRAIRACHGEYIKGIAGDDILEPECISININNIGDALMAISDLVYFDGDRILPAPFDSKILYALTHLPRKERVKLYSRTLAFFNPPTQFSSKKLTESIGVFDENSTVLEDIPFYFKVFDSDCKLTYIQKTTVRYRSSGISHDPKRQMSFQRMISDAFYKYCRPNLSVLNPIDFLVIIEKRIQKIFLDCNFNFGLRFLLSRYNFMRSLRQWMIKRTL